MSTDPSFHLHRLYLLKCTLDTFICFPCWFKSLDSSSLLLLPMALACVLTLSDQIWPRSLRPRPCLLPRAVLRRNFLKANLAQLPNGFSDAVMCVCFVWRQPSVFKLWIWGPRPVPGGGGFPLSPLCRLLHPFRFPYPQGIRRCGPWLTDKISHAYNFPIRAHSTPVST